MSVHDVSELKDEALPTALLDDIPEFGGFTEPPQPGPYRFRLPADMKGLWEPIDTPKGQRVKFTFDRDAPLTITQSAKDAGLVGTTFQTRLSNTERNRGGSEVSDLDYLLKALSPKGTKRPPSNKAYVEAVIALGSKEFGADISYNWSCNPTRNIRVADADGAVKEVEGTPGCGWRYYQGDKAPDQAKKLGYIGRTNGEYPLEITCTCGAIVRAFANLDNLRP